MPKLSRVLVVTIIVTTLATAALLWTAAQAGDPAVAVLAIVAAGAMPVSIALGGAARRAEERRRTLSGRSRTADWDGLPSATRHARHAGWIGASIGFFIGAAVVVAFAFDDRTVSTFEAVALVVSVVLIGIAIPRSYAGLDLNRRLRETPGGEYADARLIGRAVMGEDARLTPELQAAAARYAPLAEKIVTFVQNSSLIMLTGTAVMQVGMVSGSRLDVLRIGLGVADVLLGGVVIPLRIRQVRRLRSFIKRSPRDSLETEKAPGRLREESPGGSVRRSSAVSYSPTRSPLQYHRR